MSTNVSHNSDFIYLHKVGVGRWMKALRDGELSFAALGYYIYTAQKYGNKDQGDENEGVFARLKKDDGRIQEAYDYLGKDLEVIQDEEDYVKLRRSSSRYIPTFCIYGLTVGDINSSSSITSGGIQTIPHYYDDRMFSGFTESFAARNMMSEDAILSHFLVGAEVFKNRLLAALVHKGIGFKARQINYTKYSEGEFYIDPVGDKREELFYKFPYYSYQKEIRICLPDIHLMSIFDRFPLSKIPEARLSIGTKLYAEIKADIIER